MKFLFLILPVFVAAVARPLATLAMPGTNDLAKVRGVVDDLVRPELQACENGRKTRAEAADAIAAYAPQAETEAAKYLLLETAFAQHVRSGEYAKACEDYATLTRLVADVPAGTLSNWLAPLGRIKKRKGPEWAELNRLAVADAMKEHVLGEVVKLRQKLHAQPGNVELRKDIGERLVYAGDWEGARAEFAQVGGDLAKVVDWERSYPDGDGSFTPYGVGDFWWEFRAGGKKASPLVKAYRLHAAGWYKLALDTPECRGLKRTVAEQRLQEAAGYGPVVAPKPRKFQVVPAGKDNPRQMIRVPLGGPGVDLEFVECPAGVFVMGNRRRPRGLGRMRKVAITRPFWCGKTFITYDQFAAITGEKHVISEANLKLFGTGAVMNNTVFADVRKLTEKLNARFAERLPAGHVFRLLTEAEFTYALTSGGAWSNLDWPRGMDRCRTDWRDYNALRLKSGLPVLSTRDLGNPDFGHSSFLPYQRLPTPWGIHDLWSFVRTYVLERISPQRKRAWGEITNDVASKMKTGAVKDSLVWQELVERPDYQADVRDPLAWETDAEGRSYGLEIAYPWGTLLDFEMAVVWLPDSADVSRQYVSGIRLCIGPDLLKERGLKGW